jgi:hypothetical protein
LNVKHKLQIAHAIGCLMAVVFIGMGVQAIFGSGLVAWLAGGIAVVSVGLLFRNPPRVPREKKADPDSLKSVTT